MSISEELVKGKNIMQKKKAKLTEFSFSYNSRSYSAP